MRRGGLAAPFDGWSPSTASLLGKRRKQGEVVGRVILVQQLETEVMQWKVSCRLCQLTRQLLLMPLLRGTRLRWASFCLCLAGVRLRRRVICCAAHAEMSVSRSTCTSMGRSCRAAGQCAVPHLVLLVLLALPLLLLLQPLVLALSGIRLLMTALHPVMRLFLLLPLLVLLLALQWMRLPLVPPAPRVLWLWTMQVWTMQLLQMQPIS